MKIILIIIGIITALIMLFLFCAFFIASKEDLMLEQLKEEIKIEIKGKLKNIKKIVVSDPSYRSDVWCRFEKEIKEKQNYLIELGIYNETGEIDGYNYDGIKIKIVLLNETFSFFSEESLLKNQNNKSNFNYNDSNSLLKKDDFEIGMNTAKISFGVNEKANKIIAHSYKEEKTEDLLSNLDLPFALNTGTDGYFGNVTMITAKKTDIPVKIEIDGYLSSDMGYSFEELKDYFIEQFQIKKVDIDYDKEINI